jgi:hypothetical protein
MDTVSNYPGDRGDICFYLPSRPREIYFIQWGGGTGFAIIKVQDLDNHLWYSDFNEGERILEWERKRIERRFMKEIYFKLDSLIAHSVDYDSALYNPN